MNANGDVMDAFLDLVPVSDATASSLYGSLKAVFTSAEISYETNDRFCGRLSERNDGFSPFRRIAAANKSSRHFHYEMRL